MKMHYNNRYYIGRNCLCTWVSLIRLVASSAARVIAPSSGTTNNVSHASESPPPLQLLCLETENRLFIDLLLININTLMSFGVNIAHSNWHLSVQQRQVTAGGHFNDIRMNVDDDVDEHIANSHHNWWKCVGDVAWGTCTGWPCKSKKCNYYKFAWATHLNIE